MFLVFKVKCCAEDGSAAQRLSNAQLLMLIQRPPDILTQEHPDERQKSDDGMFTFRSVCS